MLVLAFPCFCCAGCWTRMLTYGSVSLRLTSLMVLGVGFDASLVHILTQRWRRLWGVSTGSLKRRWSQFVGFVFLCVLMTVLDVPLLGDRRGGDVLGGCIQRHWLRVDDNRIWADPSMVRPSVLLYFWALWAIRAFWYFFSFYSQ